MRRTLGIGMGGFVLVALFGLQHLLDQRATAQRVPTYEVDPFWPKLPALPSMRRTTYGFSSALVARN